MAVHLGCGGDRIFGLLLPREQVIVEVGGEQEITRRGKDLRDSAAALQKAGTAY